MRDFNPGHVLSRMLTPFFLMLICLPLDAASHSGQQALEEMFPRDEVLKIEITVDEDDWDEIRKQSRTFATALGPDRQFKAIESPFSYVRADVTIDGVRYRNVGLRKKGFLGSLDIAGSSRSVLPAASVDDMDRNVKGAG